MNDQKEQPEQPEQPERPEWVHCVGYGFMRAPRDPRRVAWCGRELEPWHFQDAAHASLNGYLKNRLVVCRECVEAICAALRNGHDDPEYAQEEGGEEK